jgi:hypothetical protein
MLYPVRYRAGKFTGVRMVNAVTPLDAVEKCRTCIREELPEQTKEFESYEVALPGEPLEP